MLALRPICLWPGLPAVWLLGVRRGLVVSLGFSWCVCWLLLATFVWPDWISVGVLRLAWLGAVVVWLTATVRNCWRLPVMLATADAESAAEFVAAQHEYLRGNWFEAEAKLLQILHVYSRDAEALLLLVGVLRRTRRWQSALRRLEQLDLLDTATAWRHEIARERVLIERALCEEEQETAVGEQLPLQEAAENVAEFAEAA